MNTKLPIFNAVIASANGGIYNISLVDEPATEVDFLMFSKEDEERMLMFSVNEEQKMLTAPLMLADTPLFRREGDYKFYVRYTKETLKVMAEKMLADGTQNTIDIMHADHILPKNSVNLVELYIKDATKPSPFDVPEGSLICTYHVNDDKVWEMCKNGTFKGFSLSGLFNLVPTDEVVNKFKKINNNTMSKALKTIMKMNFASVLSDLGEVFYTGEELVEGIEVYDEGGEPLADGTYVIDETHSFEVKDGVVTKVNKPEEEEVKEEPKEEVKEEAQEELAKQPEEDGEKKEEPTEEPSEQNCEEMPEEPVEEAEDVEELKKTIDELTKQIEEKDAKIAELEAKLKEAPEELSTQFEKINNENKVGYKYATDVLR